MWLVLDNCVTFCREYKHTQAHSIAACLDDQSLEIRGKVRHRRCSNIRYEEEKMRPAL